MEMNTELVCVIANLGYNDGDEYFKSIDCLESLKDMIRFLRHDDLQTCDIRRQIGRSKVLQNDLVPLLVSNPEDKWLTEILLRLLVNVTSPPHLCFEQNPVEEVTNDSSERKAHEMEIMSYLLEYKEAFTQKSAMSVVSTHLASILKKDVVDRDEDDDLFLERILLLIRNLLYVPADPDAEKRTADDVSIHDQLLWSLHENGIDDLLIYMSSSEDERNWCMHVCEIISHMFREQNAEELAIASETRSVKEKEEDTKTLKAIFEKEREYKEKVLQHRGSRHSRFGGAFWVKGRSAINEDHDLVYHRTLQSAIDMSYDFDKVPERKRKTKRALNEPDMERKSTLSIRLFLKEFCIKFLHNSYNILLSAVKSSIDSGRTQKNDESFYLSVMRFFMAFNRVYDFRVEYVSQTISVQIFSDILKLILKYDDQYCIIKPTKGKEKKIQFSRRIHLALKALKELLLYVAVMLKTNNENLMAVADVIQSNIFYIEEYRNVFLDLLRHWNPAFQARDYLKDVIESFHLYLKLFESFLKDKGTFLTQKRTVKKTQAPKRKKDVPVRYQIEITEEQAEHLWQNEISVMLSACIQGRDGGIPDDTILPFDLNSDLPDEEQILNAFATIQILLKRRQPREAIAFLRASRECWPDESKFGILNMPGEEEFMCARAIFFMNIPPEILRNADSRLHTAEVQEETEEVLDFKEEEVEDEIGATGNREKLFDLKKFLRGLAVPYIVESYCNMLKTYNRNRAHTNHCIIKMLTRIAIDLDMFPMLFQLSLFVTFKKILQDPKTDANKEVKGFARYIVRKFFDVYKTNPMVVVDLLFWKSNAECYEIVEGYGSLEKQRSEKTSSDVGKWNFEEEQELLDLYHELKDEADVIEKITERLSEKGRTSKQVRSKLVRLRVLEKPKKRKGNEWTEEETEELRHLYEEFKSTDEPLTNIMQALTFSKSKKWVISRLLEIGLVENRKELSSKRRKKNKTSENQMSENDDLIIDEDKDTEYEGEDAGSAANGNEEDIDESESLDDESAVNSSLRQILQKLVNEGFGNEIAWIGSRLVRVGNERENAEEDEWQPVPLVPITDDHQNALSNKLFKLMLKRVGMSPPTNKQEAFWRISKSLSPSEIRDFTHELECASKSVFSASTQKKEKKKTSFTKVAYNQEDESDDDIFEKFISGSKSHPLKYAEDEESEKNYEAEGELDSNSLKDPDKFNEHFSDDSNDEVDGTMKKQDEHLGVTSSKSSLVRGKRTRRIAFSDDDDDEDDNYNVDNDDNGDDDEEEDLSMQHEGIERKKKKIKKIEESDEDEAEKDWTHRNNDITVDEVVKEKDMNKVEANKVSVNNKEYNGGSFSKLGNEICNSSEEIYNHIDGETHETSEEEKSDSIGKNNGAFDRIANKETSENSSGGSFVLEISMDEGNSDD